jgi:hypothetical protein
MMPDDWKEQIGGHDAIFFGAVGWPAKIPDHVSLWGSLIKFRRDFDLFVNLRPARLMPGVRSPLAGMKPGDIDMMIVRENTEGEYSSIGGRMFEGTDREVVVQETVMSRFGIDRVLKYAFELAQSRPKKHLTSATKSNGIAITMPYWDERVDAMAKRFPDVRADRYHIDILTAHFVQRPQIFDTVVASNLFGDILSDLGPACTGTIGIAPSANINPDARAPVAVRAGARLGARHRRAGHRQPDRPDLVGRADARLPRPPRRARRDHRGDRSRPRSELGRPQDARPRRHGEHHRPRPCRRRRALFGERCIALGALSSIYCTSGAGIRGSARKYNPEPCLTLQIRNAVIVSPRRAPAAAARRTTEFIRDSFLRGKLL